MQNLWPTELTQQVINEKSPASILQEQATLLAEQTNNIIRGELRQVGQPSALQKIASSMIFGDTDTDDLLDYFRYRFIIIAPQLNYQFGLFLISYNHNLYPVKIKVDEDIAAEMGHGDEKSIIANTETNFVVILRQIFRSTKTLRIIQSILDHNTVLVSTN